MVKALPAGDYSLQGFEDKVAIERKSMADFVHTVVHGRERFEAELQKLTQYEYAWVIVEGSLDDILFGNYRSKINPGSLLGITTALMTDYIPMIFAYNRACARALTEALLLRCYKRLLLKEKTNGV